MPRVISGKKLLLTGISALCLIGYAAPAAATTCNDGVAATIDATDCTVETGTIPTTVTFDNGPAGTLILDGESPTGAIDATTPGEGIISVIDYTTLAAGATIGLTTPVQALNIGNAAGLDANTNNISTIRATTVTVGGPGNGNLDLGDTDVTVTTIDGGGGAGNVIAVRGNASITGDVGQVNGIDINVFGGGGNLTVNGNLRSTVILESGATLSLTGISEFEGALNGDSSGNGGLIIDNIVTTNGNIGANQPLATVTVNAGNKLDLSVNNNTLDATTTFLGNNGFLVVGSGQVTSNIDGLAPGQGILQFMSATTLTGNIGAGGRLDIVEISGDTEVTGTVNTDDLKFFGNATLTLGNDVTVTNGLDFNGVNATVIFEDNADMNGDILDAGDGSGTVEFNGSSSVTGAVGLAGSRVSDITFLGGTGEQVFISGGMLAVNAVSIDGEGLVFSSGDITAGGIDFGSAGTLRVFDGGTITAPISNDSGTDGTGSLDLLGNATLVGTFGVDGMELENFTINGEGKTVNVTGNFEAADLTTIDGNTLNVDGTFDADAGQTLVFNITSATTSGQITATGAATIDENAIVTLNMATADQLALNQSFILVDGTGGAGVDDLVTAIADGFAMLNFTQDTTNDEDLEVLVTRTAIADVAETKQTADLGEALDDLGDNGNDQLDDIQDAISQAGSLAEVQDILDSLLPTTDGAIVGSTFQTSVQSLGVTTNRLDSIRTANAGGSATGISAGNAAGQRRVWLQGFGKTADQDLRDGIAGYESDTFGTAFGMDTEKLDENMILGFAGSYAATDVDSDNLNNTQADIDSYQATLYGDYSFNPLTYLQGMLGYAHNDIEQTRYNVGIAGNTVNADFDSAQYIAFAKLNRDYATGGNCTVTPHILAHYQHIDIDDYTETSAGGAFAHVDGEEMDIFELGAGAKAVWALTPKDGWQAFPGVHAGFRYDLVGDDVSSSTTYTGGNVSFNTNGADPAQATFNLGASIDFVSEQGWDLTGAYDYEAKEDYGSHSGIVRATYKF